MPRWLQALLSAVNVGAGTVASLQWRTPTPAIVAGAVQVAITQVAHVYNTDGTSQKSAFVGKEK